MLRLICVLLFCFASAVYAAEDPNDTYLHRSDCPAVGGSYPVDTSSNFYKCQCTSYVAHKLNEKWGNSSPRFTNQYYGFSAWSDAWKWLDRATSSQAEIGVTGARDNFVWDIPSYNAVFVGDVALWKKHSDGYPVGHVAYVEAAGQDAYGKGVAWVTVSEYNFTSFEYSRRTLYKSNHPNPRFPDYFLHIDKDRTYCLANPTVDSCPSLLAGQQVANGPGSKVGGIGGGSDKFNLKIDFDIMNSSTGQEIIAGTKDLVPGQVVNLKVQVQAKDGNTSTHMRPGKNRIEVDYYVRMGDDDWQFLSRQYIQATNLPSGGTHTETVQYTVPKSISTVSFKVKIDAEDEAYESNESDNWSRIETFSVYYRTGIHRILRTED
jgi:surface antigen